MRFLRKNGWKFLLDVVLAVLLALMYNKRVLGLEFHEIGGLALYGLFIIHKLLNGKWIKAVTAGLFSSRTPVRQKVYWVLDILLFACFTFIIVTGILISKVVFPGSSGDVRYKIGHYAVAAVALALAGIHAGLHTAWIGQRMKFLRKWPALLRRSLAVALSVAVLAFGAMQITSTSFLTWVGNLGALTTVSTAAAQELNETAATAGDEAAPAEAASDTESGNGHGGGGQGLRDGLGPHGNGNGNGAEASNASVWSVLLSFLSIFAAFAVAAAWVDGGLKALRRRRRRKAAAAPPEG